MEKGFRAMRVVEGVTVTLLGTIGVWVLTYGREPVLRLVGVAGEPKATVSASPAPTPAAHPSPRVTPPASAPRRTTPPVTVAPVVTGPAFPAVLAGEWPAVVVAPDGRSEFDVRAGRLQVAEDGQAKWSFEVRDSGYVVTVRCWGTFRAPDAVTGERRTVGRTENPSVEPSTRALLLLNRLTDDQLYAYLCEGTFDVRYERVPGKRVTSFVMTDGARSFTWSRD